jgi:hypothetical protein
MNPVIKYFNGERSESYLFLILGILGLVIGGYFFIVKASTYWKGFAIPFMLVSLLEIIVGLSLIYRSPKDITRIVHYMNNEKIKIQTVEIPRMNKVMKNFVLYRYVEITLIFIGALLFFTSANTNFWRGLGLGLFLQASLVLTLDYFAERRGFNYLNYLNSFSYE